MKLAHASGSDIATALILATILLGHAKAYAMSPCKQDSTTATYECTGVQTTPYQYTTGSWEGTPSWVPPAYSETDALERMEKYLANYFAASNGFCSNVLASNNVDWVVTRSDYGIPLTKVRTYGYTLTSYYIQPPGNPSCGNPRSTQNLLTVTASRIDYCPGGWTPAADSSNNLYCMRVDTPPCFSCSITSPFASSGAQAAAAGGYVGNPVFAENGDKSLDETDFSSGGSFPLKLRRRYLSTGFVWQYKTPPPTFPFGPYWRSDFDQRLYAYQGSAQNTMIAYRADGAVLYFYQNGNNWTPRAEQAERLNPVMSGGTQIGWDLTTGGNDVESYDMLGRLVSLTRVGGWVWNLAYNGAGQLATVTDGFGRQLTFGYSAAGLVDQIDAPDGGSYGYTYDMFSNLTTVIYPTGVQKKYLYNEPANTSSSKLGLLTGIIDENGVRFATYKYNSVGQATSTEHAGGVEKFAVAPNQSNHQGIVTDPFGTARTYYYTSVLGITRFTGVYPPCTGCAQTIAYDTNGNPVYILDFNNKKVCYAYDLTRNLETVRVEGALSTENCTTVLTTLPGRVDVRKVSTQWHPVWRLPLKVAEPNRITINTYNGDGGVYCAPATALVGGNPLGVLCTKSMQATTDTTGQQAFTATSTGAARVWQYTYDSYGQVLTVTDPNGMVTTTAYYAANDPDMGKRGNVHTITNPLNQVTKITAYDLNGRPLSITDPNGVVTTLAYHPRGWLASRTVGGEVTSYAYDGVGQLTKVTLPDGSQVQYTYDAAHRLTQLQDGLGNKVVYTLDAMGNRTAEQAFDPAGGLARTKGQVFDSLNLLHQSVGAQ